MHNLQSVALLFCLVFTMGCPIYSGSTGLTGKGACLGKLCPAGQQACSASAECASSEGCVFGLCEPLSETCNANGACGEHRVCVNGGCTPTCVDDSACGSGTRCQNGICLDVVQCDGLNLLCTNARECVLDQCLSACNPSNPCLNLADYCAADGYCHQDWRLTQACVQDAGSCDDQTTRTCRMETDCASKFCVDGVCKDL